MREIIVLTGPKHCGKSAVSRALSDILPADCRDVDEEIEKRTGKSPRALYTEGPDAFRTAEAAALAALLREEGSFPIVIAAGGGLVDNPAALSALKDRPDVRIVYLETSPAAAWERIERAARDGGGLPPFLHSPDPEATHRALHTRRAAAYKALARHTIQCEQKSPHDIALEIQRLLV
ncbi:MAG: shikimate kinase [Spirochaetaceae bacterium]|jgi:shikimate kinase|nr:shikimate kinase [Spirochaetaceae bacterium]